MKILVLIHEFPPIGGGGGLIARDLAAGLVRSGHQVRVLTSNFEDMAEKETVDGVEIVRLNVGRKEAFRADFKSMLLFVVKAGLNGLFASGDFKPDLIHAHFAVPAGAAAFVLFVLKRIPYALTVHLGDIPGASPEKTGAWFKRIYPLTVPVWRMAAKIIAVSRFSRSLALRSYRVPIDVIPNGIDRAESGPRLPLKIGDPVQIVFAGRFVPQKNLDQILRTLSGLRGLQWRCVLIGNGAEYEEIRAKVNEEYLADRIELPGWVEPAQVVEIFRNSDILFLPSRTEGLPIVGIQAMAAGLALVLSNAGGNPEIVSIGENGYIADPEDTDGFKRALSELIQDREKLLAFKQKSLKLSAAYDIANVVEAYEKSFAEITRPAQ